MKGTFLPSAEVAVLDAMFFLARDMAPSFFFFSARITGASTWSFVKAASRSVRTLISIERVRRAIARTLLPGVHLSLSRERSHEELLLLRHRESEILLEALQAKLELLSLEIDAALGLRVLENKAVRRIKERAYDDIKATRPQDTNQEIWPIGPEVQQSQEGGKVGPKSKRRTVLARQSRHDHITWEPATREYYSNLYLIK